MKVEQAIKILKDAAEEGPFKYTTIKELGWIGGGASSILSDHFYDEEAIYFAIKVLRCID